MGRWVVGLFDGKELRPVGSVGTGFDEKKQQEIFETLKSLRVDKSPFRPVPKLAEEVEWVRPEMVARGEVCELDGGGQFAGAGIFVDAE